MSKIKNKISSKKICISILSSFFIFVMATPTFSSAEMKRPVVIPTNILYDASTGKILEYYGEIIDNNSEEINWKLGTDELVADLKVKEQSVDQGKMPIDSFAFMKARGKKQLIICNDSLKSWLRENANAALEVYNCKEIKLIVTTRLLGKVEGMWYNIEAKLAEIIIKDTTSFNAKKLYVPPYKRPGYQYRKNIVRS